MQIRGYLRKMQAEMNDESVDYSLVVDNESYALENAIGHEIEIRFLNQLQCMACGKSTKKSYNQGFCYVCFIKLARNDLCVMKPELCHFAQGTCREPEWGMAKCMKPHIVYLAWSSGLKVGLTHPSQIPTRWLDQGASYAISICQVASRYHAGLVEDYLRTWYNDRTNWRKMITIHGLPDVDLLDEVKLAQKRIQDSDLPDELIKGVEYFNHDITSIQYPADFFGPIKSLSLDKLPHIKGRLLGIKGQYLILDIGVFNVRKHTSYLVEVSI